MFKYIALGMLTAFAYYGLAEHGKNTGSNWIAACVDAGWSKSTCVAAEIDALYQDRIVK